MKVYAVTPIHVAPEEVRRRQARYDALSPAGLRIELHDVGPDAPRALETEQQVRDSEGLVLAALEAAPDDADALMPDCVLDPGVAELASRSDRPVFGLLRTTLTWTALTGRRAAAVTRNEAIGAELQRVAGLYGLGDVVTGVEVLHLDVDAIHEGDRWGEALRPVAHRAAQAGASRLVNGCSAVDLPADAPSWPAVVVDPTALALRLVAAGEGS